MSKKIAIHTKTQEEFNSVLEIFEKKGWKWSNRDVPTDNMGYWSSHKEDTCIVYNNHFGYCTISFYEVELYKIISFQKFLEMQGLGEEKESSIKDKLHNAMIPRDNNKIITDGLDKICGVNDLKKGDKCYVSDESEEEATIKSLKGCEQTSKEYFGECNGKHVVYDIDGFVELKKYAVPIPKKQPKEEKPKFKVGDNVVFKQGKHGSTNYIKITSIKFQARWQYGVLLTYTEEEYLRTPTQQELEKYFK